MTDFYAKRIAAKDEFYKMMYKFGANSLYGKFGQGNDKIEVTSLLLFDEKKIDSSDVRVYDDLVVYSVTGDYPVHSNMIWAAYTTSYARIFLHESIARARRAGADILYCDTDSIFYGGSAPLPVSRQMGDFKDEGTFAGVDIQLPKTYRLIGGPVRAKGIPRAKQTEFFERGRVSFKKPMKLKESLRRDIPVNVWLDHEKRSKWTYNKGKKLKSGYIVPLVI